MTIGTDEFKKDDGTKVVIQVMFYDSVFGSKAKVK